MEKIENKKKFEWLIISIFTNFVSTFLYHHQDQHQKTPETIKINLQFWVLNKVWAQNLHLKLSLIGRLANILKLNPSETFPRNRFSLDFSPIWGRILILCVFHNVLVSHLASRPKVLPFDFGIRQTPLEFYFSEINYLFLIFRKYIISVLITNFSCFLVWVIKKIAFKFWNLCYKVFVLFTLFQVSLNVFVNWASKADWFQWLNSSFSRTLIRHFESSSFTVFTSDKRVKECQTFYVIYFYNIQKH